MLLPPLTHNLKKKQLKFVYTQLYDIENISKLLFKKKREKKHEKEPDSWTKKFSRRMRSIILNCSTILDTSLCIRASFTCTGIPQITQH